MQDNLGGARRHARALAPASGPTKTLNILAGMVSPPAPMEAATPVARPSMQKLNGGATGPVAAGLLARLKSRIVGHEPAMEELCQAIQRHRAGIGSPLRPIGAYMMVGPTGSGKTQAAKVLAELVTGKPNALIRIDCAEYGERHEVAKLIGAPPGYLGHRESEALLANKRLQAQTTESQPLSFVLFDEIEKAHDRMLDLLLGILDAGRLTLGDNTVSDFRNTLILMTSNAGAEEMQKALTRPFGLAQGVPAATAAKAGNLAESAVKRSLRPEFINRLDKILVFQQLTEAEVASVLQLELADLETRMLSGAGVGLTVSPEAKQALAAASYDPQYGARHLKRNIERDLTTVLANLVTSGQVNRGSVVRVELADDGSLEFWGA